MNLTQLRRQAKELRDAARRGDPAALQRVAAVAPGPGQPVALSLAQLVVARENGYPSWPSLKAAADDEHVSLARFLDISLHGPQHEALAMLSAHPYGRDSAFAAAALGEPDRAVAAAAAVDNRGWTPLLYACYSRWHQFEPRRSAGLTDTVAALLDAGASPNSHNGRLPGQGYQSALHGAVVSDKPDVVALLLSHGALTDDRSSLPAAADLRHHRCLELLLEAGAAVERTWALGAAVGARDPWAVRRLLDAVVAGGGDAAAQATEQLEDAARDGSASVIEVLLASGADATRQPDLVREAVRAGSSEAVELLAAHAGSGEVTATDWLIGACLRGDRVEAQRLAAQERDSSARRSNDDHAVLVQAAGRATAVSIELLLDAGWPLDARDDLGETALHNAAYQGRLDTVTLLLSRGATVDARDERFDSTPLAFAAVGSRERADDADADADGDWAGTVQALLDAGASRDRVWLSGDKAPSDEVAAIFRSYDVAPEPEPPPDIEASGDAAPAELALGPLAEIAALLRIAFETADLDLFASLLAPDARWGGGPLGCATREQVVAQYQQSVDLGFHGTVGAAEAYGDRLIIELTYAGAAQGMPTGPAGTRAQVLRVVDDLIVSIDGYPDVAHARQAIQPTDEG